MRGSECRGIHLQRIRVKRERLRGEQSAKEIGTEWRRV